MEYYFAPMEGVTGAEYRAVHHRHIPGEDRKYKPYNLQVKQVLDENKAERHIRGGIATRKKYRGVT